MAAELAWSPLSRTDLLEIYVIIGLENYLAAFGEWVTVITGAIFVVCVLAFRRGFVGEIMAWWSQRRS